MKVSYDEGLASHIGSESCGSIREDALEALTGVRAGWVLSLENVYIRSADAENFQFRAGIANLAVELLQHLDGIFDRVALGELIGLGKDAPLVILGHEHGLGGGGAAIDADEPFDDFALVEGFG